MLNVYLLLNQLNQCEHEFADEVGIPLKYLEAGFTPEVSENNLRITCRLDIFRICLSVWSNEYF